MSDYNLSRRLTAEALGTALLVATVVGSGIMADKLTQDTGLALLGNTLPTGAILVVLILILGPVSGAHFNPAVSMAFAARGELAWREAGFYTAAQGMFDLSIWQVSTTVRSGFGQCFAEVVATFGLLLTIFGCLATAPTSTP